MIEPVLDDYIQISRKLDREAFAEKIGVPLLIAPTAEQKQTFQDEPTFNAFRVDPDALENADVNSALAPGMPVIEIRSMSESIEVIVGRDEANDIVIQDETISANHAMFEIESYGKTLLRDLGSTNGTKINQEELKSGRAIELKDGDEVAFGNACYLFFTPGGLHDMLTVVFPDLPSGGIRPVS